jgi:peptide/nickel transport system substrate-binding protein
MPKSEKDKKEQVVSMREAFDVVSPKKNGKRKSNGNGKDKKTVRDFFWNYPDTVSKLVKLTSPLSTILLFALIGFGLFSFLRSDTFAERVSSRETNYYVEGRVGAISTFNPLFSNQNDVDKAIQELVFEKFIYIDANGEIMPGIAQRWNITDGGKVYEFDIELDHTWSDGEPLTVEDVYFTFDTAIKLYSDQGYDTVASGLVEVDIEIVDEDTIKFTLPETNALFTELASVYIVPEHILGEVSLQEMPFDRFSRNPVGSGPYRIYRSEPNIVYLQSSEYFTPKANISNIIVRIYSEVEKLESAFRNGLLDSAMLPSNSSTDFIDEYGSYESHELNLPYRQRMLFFNLRKEKFQNESLRRGISLLIDKEKLLDQSGIDGKVTHGPIYENNWAYSDVPDYPKYSPEEAIEVLKNAGYTKNETNGYFEDDDDKLLTFTVSYLSNDINEHLLTTLKELLNEEGVIVNLEPLNYSQLTQEILATRNFELLMYEIEVTIDPDQYNLWHSLKKDYPDLNLSGYEYDRVDILLEEGRTELSRTVRKEKYDLFQKYLMDDAPAILLYRPTYVYIVPKDIEGPNLEEICYPEDRFRNIAEWIL